MTKKEFIEWAIANAPHTEGIIRAHWNERLSWLGTLALVGDAQSNILRPRGYKYDMTDISE